METHRQEEERAALDEAREVQDPNLEGAVDSIGALRARLSALSDQASSHDAPNSVWGYMLLLLLLHLLVLVQCYDGSALAVLTNKGFVSSRLA